MPQPNRVDLRGRLVASARQTLSMAVSLLPILIGVVLLTGLLLELLPAKRMAEWFGRSDVLDAFVGALAGSVASGHPLTSYLLGGELLDRGVSLSFEASVGGGIPVLLAVRDGLAANRIEQVLGIVNGTSNYILTTMAEEGGSFSDVLADARCFNVVDIHSKGHVLLALGAVRADQEVALVQVHGDLQEQVMGMGNPPGRVEKTWVEQVGDLRERSHSDPGKGKAAQQPLAEPGPQAADSVGADPATKGSSTASGQLLSLRNPDTGSIQTRSILSGSGKMSGSGSSLAIISPQTVIAPAAPVRPAGRSSSRPTHTTARRSPVKPANQLSRKASVVPVFPATCNSAGSRAARPRAVPSRTTSWRATVSR